MSMLLARGVLLEAACDKGGETCRCTRVQGAGRRVCLCVPCAAAAAFSGTAAARRALGEGDAPLEAQRGQQPCASGRASAPVEVAAWAAAIRGVPLCLMAMRAKPSEKASGRLRHGGGALGIRKMALEKESTSKSGG